MRHTGPPGRRIGRVPQPHVEADVQPLAVDIEHGGPRRTLRQVHGGGKTAQPLGPLGRRPQAARPGGHQGAPRRIRPGTQPRTSGRRCTARS